MKKYLCLAYYDVEKFNALSDADRDALVRQCPACDAELNATGRLLFAGSLADLDDWACLRPRKGKPVVTDGPYAEAKEIVGGVFMIEAADRDEAIRIAAKHPAATLGEQVGWGIEMLPIDHYIAGSSKGQNS